MATFQLFFQSREQVVVYPLDELSTAFILQYVLQLHQQKLKILHVDSLALWKIINEEDATLIPQNKGEKFSSGFLHTEVSGAG
jgi:hypothetical protein